MVASISIWVISAAASMGAGIFGPGPDKYPNGLGLQIPKRRAKLRWIYIIKEAIISPIAPSHTLNID